ncbi:hypothetical protein BDF22DRAFT_686570 [Syncephalis plumigaleata]|nr:hypothetical protein BDF22DRAFT_686570 [Syncephalis plumigaleata]
MIEPSNCAARGYIWEKFYFLGCFVAARTTATTGAVSESNDAKCKADDSASAKTTTANDYWRVCNTTAPVIYQAVDPNTRQLTNCDVSTELPSNAGTIHGCYRMSDNNGGSSDVSSFAGLQCMSNGRLLNCTGTWQRLFTLTSGAGLPATSSNGNGMIQNDNESANDGASSKMSPAAWAGIIGGVAVGGVGIVGMAILFTRRYILKRRAQQDQMRRLTEFGS